MPIVVVAAGVAAYKYYENKRQNSRTNLAAANEDGDGNSDGGAHEAEKDSKPETPMLEAKECSAGGEKEPTIVPPEEDEETESLSSAESLADEGNDSAQTSNKSASAPASSPTVLSDEQATVKLTLLQQWNEKYPHLAAQQQQQQRGRRRQRWGGPGAFLRRNLDEWRSAPPVRQASTATKPPAATSAGSAPAMESSAVYSEVWDVLSFREEQQEEKVVPPPPARHDTSRDQPKLPPQPAVSRLARIRRSINGWRGTDNSAAADGAARTDPREVSSNKHMRCNGDSACYPEVWDLIFGKDGGSDESLSVRDSVVDPPKLVAPRLGAFRRSVRAWRSSSPPAEVVNRLDRDEEGGQRTAESGCYEEVWNHLFDIDEVSG